MSGKAQQKKLRTEPRYAAIDPVITKSARGLLHNPSQSVAYRRAVNSTVDSVILAVEASLGRQSKHASDQDNSEKATDGESNGSAKAASPQK